MDRTCKDATSFNNSDTDKLSNEELISLARKVQTYAGRNILQKLCNKEIQEWASQVEDKLREYTRMCRELEELHNNYEASKRIGNALVDEMQEQYKQRSNAYDRFMEEWHRQLMSHK